MSVQLNHTIVWCRDKQKSASFLVEMLALPAPVPFGPMLVVHLSNGGRGVYFDDPDGHLLEAMTRPYDLGG